MSAVTPEFQELERLRSRARHMETIMRISNEKL